MIRQSLIGFLTISTLFLTAACAEKASAPLNSVEVQLDQLLNPLVENDLISGSVLIARGDQIVVAKGYGLANREHQAPNTVDTVFQLASVSKAITSIAVMQLVEAGKLNLDEALSSFFPDFPHSNRITVAMLLTHSSGIPSYVFRPDFDRQLRQKLSPEAMRLWIGTETLDFEPGTQFKYSNSGFALLAMIVEERSDMPYENYLRENIFNPAGMDHSGLSSFTTILSNRADGHSRDGCSGKIIKAGFREPRFDRGAGSLYSTVGDLYRLHQALKEGNILGRAAVTEMQKPRLQSSWGDAYGYGWFVGESHGRRLIHHEGGTSGFMTTLRRFVDDDVVVIALFNQDLIIANEIFSKLDAIALGEPWEQLFSKDPDAVGDFNLADFAGLYSMEPEGSLVVRLDQNTLWLKEPGCQEFEIWAMTATRGFATEANALLRFHIDDQSGLAEVQAQYGVLRWEGTRIPQD